MDEKAALTTKDRVQHGVELFAGMESGLRSAADLSLELRELFERCYQEGDIKSGETTVEMMDECLGIAGMIGAAKARALALHRKATDLAQAQGQDIATPYAELAPRKRQTRSGDR